MGVGLLLMLKKLCSLIQQGKLIISFEQAWWLIRLFSLGKEQRQAFAQEYREIFGNFDLTVKEFLKEKFGIVIL